MRKEERNKEEGEKGGVVSMDLANNDRRGAESLKGPEPAVNRSLHLTDTMSQDDEKVDNDWDHQSREYSEPLRTTERPPADDESNMFMSDPSFSEGGDSSVSGHVRARHRYGPPPPIIAQPSPVPSSPGNTSLSSWDSPAINNRVLLHFTPDRTNVRRKKSSSGNVVSDSSHENSSQSRQPPPLPSMNTSDHQQQRTLDGASNTSRAPSFDGHRLHALGNFIDHLRHRSTGALRNSPPSAPGGSVPGAAPSQVSAVMRSGAVSSDNTQQGAVATDPRSPQSSINESLRAGDISIAMTLSDSENEGDQTLALFGTAHTDDGDDEADWEAEKSAEDVNTAKRLPRLSPRLRVHAAGKSSSTGHGHGRTRSGDGAAAALATGGKDWKGMEQDRIPIPVENCSGDEDEDDDDGDSNRGIFTMQSRRRDRVSQSREDKNKPEGASLSTHVSPSASLRNPSHSSLPPTHVSPGASLRNPSQSSLPPIHVSPGASLRNPSHSSLPPTHVSPGASLRNPSHSSLPPEQEDRGWGENIRSSDSHRESLIYSQTSGETPGEYTGEENDSDSDSNDGEPRMSVLENRLPYPTDAHDLDDFERHFEDRQVRGAHQNIRRTSSPRRPSPFENIGKNSTEKANRKTFMPQSSVIGDDPKAYATYMCPRCRTVQREFFTVADAPRHVETASGYLALYFAIYVIASLFIFGLEEGWEPLDCIYFAVVTLTTAGLGDKVPTTDANKIICSIFIYFGVACIGLLLGSYIAGMLDDRAFRDAKTKQINSCPNCARLQTMRDAAKVGSRSSYSPTQPAPLRTNMKRHMSERIYGKPPQQQDHTALYVSGHHHKRGHSGSPRRIPVPKPERVSDRSNHSDQFELTPPFTDSEHVREGSGSYDSQNGSQGHASSYSSQQPSPNTMAMGSPMTRQILGRQSHTRHGSMDIRGNEFFGGGVKSGGAKTYGAIRTRGFSADVTSAQNPPPIGENEPFYGNNPMPKVPFVPGGYSGTGGVNDDDGDYISDADESIYSSSSSTSTEVLLDDTATKIRTAKYVFLTLRQALVNSMVIIAVGCIGFWLIEGFSLVDSWYFTTVFLTTVGYGDIVPVTKGGKLFATVYILVGGTILLNNMSLISMIPLELRKRRIERAVLTQFGDQLDDAALRELATGPLIQRLHLSASRSDGLDECTREMFSLAMLVRLGKVNEQDIRETFASFRRLDVNDEGVLNSKSIIAAMIQKRRLQQSSQQNLQNLDRPPPPPLNIPQPPREQSGEQGGPANVWVDNNGAPQNTYFFQDPPREQSGEQGGPAKVWIDNNGAPQNTYFFQDPPREQSGEQQGRANVWVDNNGAPHNTYFFQDSPREQSGEHEGPASVWTDNNGSPQNTYLYQDPEAGTERSFLLPHDETTPGSYRRVSPAGSRLGQKNSPHESPF